MAQACLAACPPCPPAPQLGLIFIFSRARWRRSQSRVRASARWGGRGRSRHSFPPAPRDGSTPTPVPAPPFPLLLTQQPPPRRPAAAPSTVWRPPAAAAAVTFVRVPPGQSACRAKSRIEWSNGFLQILSACIQMAWPQICQKVPGDPYLGCVLHQRRGVHARAPRREKEGRLALVLRCHTGRAPRRAAARGHGGGGAGG